MISSHDNSPPTPPASAKRPAEHPIVNAQQLFGDKRELVIVHNGERYRLRITANDKLILTK
ncbi:Hemin uptake protein HemP [Hyphomicrobiales bacterium]|nr:Hemin uptake protein HemP [Hyphomicrobiales bacterium]CAH1667185.1 Hemin uptake protein HemP [Hyphomicrobiales bacterium]